MSRACACGESAQRCQSRRREIRQNGESGDAESDRRRVFEVVNKGALRAEETPDGKSEAREQGEWRERAGIRGKAAGQARG